MDDRQAIAEWEREFRRQRGLGPYDPLPVSLPSLLFEDDHARHLEEERDEIDEALIWGGEGSEMVAGGGGADSLGAQKPRGPADQKYILIDGKYRLNPKYDPPFDITLGQAIAIPPLIGAAGVLLPEAAAAAAGAYRFARAGRELSFGPNFRIAPFGNRTGHPTGKYPHYHRRPSAKPPPGQSIDRHRPWDKDDRFDTNWRDRF